MDDKVDNLSDEMLELYTSFECEDSMENEQNAQSSTSRFCHKVVHSSDNMFLPSTNGYSADISFNTNDTATSNLTRNFQRLSLDYSTHLSRSKLKDLKTAYAEANDAYVQYMISQFILDCCKASEQRISASLAHKVRKIMSASRLDKVKILKTRNGKTLNILGLSTNSMKAATDVLLNSLEVQELKEHVLNIFNENLETQTEQKKSLKGWLSPHCEKIVEADSLLPRENVRLAELRQELGEQLTESNQLTTSKGLTLQQLATLVQNSELELSRVTYQALRDKAEYLHTSTSVLKLKADQALHRDADRVKAINNLGDELKTRVEELSHRLKSVQKTLAEYEKKEETSKQYNEIVTEYAKSKRLLNHKYQTLSLLNESNISFS